MRMGMKMAPNYLSRTGYRLPTESGMGVCLSSRCRDAGISFGESDDLLGKYAWFDANSLGKSHPVGSLKSNDLGLFDMHGNAWEWCQDAYEEDKGGEGTGIEDIRDTNNRVFRGGSFGLPPSVARSAFRNFTVPTLRFTNDFGFRPAQDFYPLTASLPYLSLLARQSATMAPAASLRSEETATHVRPPVAPAAGAGRAAGSARRVVGARRPRST